MKTREEYDDISRRYHEKLGLHSLIGRALETKTGKQLFAEANEFGDELIDYVVDDCRHYNLDWFFEYVFTRKYPESTKYITEVERGRFGNVQDAIVRWYDERQGTRLENNANFSLHPEVKVDFHVFFDNKEYNGSMVWIQKYDFRIDIDGKPFNHSETPLYKYIMEQFKATREELVRDLLKTVRKPFGSRLWAFVFPELR